MSEPNTTVVIHNEKRDRIAAAAAAAPTASEPRVEMTILKRDYSAQSTSTPSQSINGVNPVPYLASPSAAGHTVVILPSADNVRESQPLSTAVHRSDDTQQSTTTHAPANALTDLLRRVSSGTTRSAQQSAGDVTLDVRDYDAVPTDSPGQSPKQPTTAGWRSGERRNSADEQR